MDMEVIITGDGSHSVSIRERNISFHSKYGAIRESVHVFIDAGMRPLLKKHPQLRIFEMGFGTGLNALLTLLMAEQAEQSVVYQAIDNCPLEKSITGRINYCSQLDQPGMQTAFEKLHDCEWDKDIPISKWFMLRKLMQNFIDYTAHPFFHLVYYDAFDPLAQPELWEKEIFEKLFSMLLPAGVLVTYSSSGKVRRAMGEAGFTVQKLPGPPHKREIVRAVKQI